jgi:hypothetical protein
MRKYLRKLSDGILDDRNTFVEFLLLNIAGALWLLVLFAILGSCSG